MDEEGWLRQRRRRAGLDREFSMPGQLGVVEGYFAVDGGRIADLVLAGDFIAPSGTVDRLERALRGCPADPEVVADVVRAVLGEPENFLLGLGRPADTAAALARAIAG